ncbi:MAG TPA: GAF domain-containing protein, partial [Flavisolibacter sp.]
MKRNHEQIHKEVLLSLGRGIAGISNKEDVLKFIIGVLRKYLRFGNGLIIKYNTSRHTYSSSISQATNQEDGRDLHTSWPIKYFIDAHSLNDTTILFWNKDNLSESDIDQIASISKNGVEEIVTLKLGETTEFIDLVIFFSAKKSHHTGEEIELLKEICHLTSIGIANIATKEEIAKREEEKTVLLSLSTEIAAVRNRVDFFNILNKRINELFSVTEFGIAQIDEDGRTYSAFSLEFSETTRSDVDYHRITAAKYSVDDPIFTKAMAATEPVLFNVNEMAQLPGMPAYVEFWKKAGFRYYLTVPLRAGGSNIGFINLHIENPQTYNIKNILLKGVSDQLAVAVSNILANEKIQRKDQEKTTLLSLSNEIARVKTREDLFRIVNSKIKDLFLVDEFVLAKIDDEGQSCVAFVLDVNQETRNHSDFNTIVTARFSTSDEIFTSVFASEDAVVFDVATLSKKRAVPAYVEFWSNVGIRKMLLIALRAGGEKIGIAGFPVDNIPDFDVKNVLLKGICAQLAVAMSNILTNEKVWAREDEKNLLLSLSNEIAALKNRQDLFKVVNGKVKQLFGIRELGFSKIDEGGETYSIFLVDVGDRVKSHPHFKEILTAQFSIHDPLFSAVMKLED